MMWTRRLSDLTSRLSWHGSRIVSRRPATGHRDTGGRREGDGAGVGSETSSAVELRPQRRTVNKCDVV